MNQPPRIIQGADFEKASRSPAEPSPDKIVKLVPTRPEQKSGVTKSAQKRLKEEDENLWGKLNNRIAEGNQNAIRDEKRLQWSRRKSTKAPDK